MDPMVLLCEGCTVAQKTVSVFPDFNIIAL